MSQSTSNIVDDTTPQPSDKMAALFYSKMAETPAPIEVDHSANTGYPTKYVTILSRKDEQEPTPSQLCHARSKPRTFPIVDKLKWHCSRRSSGPLSATDSDDNAQLELQSPASRFTRSLLRRQSSVSSDGGRKQSRSSFTTSSLRRVFTFGSATSTSESAPPARKISKPFLDDDSARIIYDEPESIELSTESPAPRTHAGEKLRDPIDSGYDPKASEDTAISYAHVTSANETSSVYSTDVINESEHASNSLLPAIRLTYDSARAAHADLLQAISTSHQTLHNADLLARTYVEDLGDRFSDTASINTTVPTSPATNKPPPSATARSIIDMSKEIWRTCNDGSDTASLEVHVDEDRNERQASEAEDSADLAGMDRMEVETKEHKAKQRADDAQHELSTLVRETGKCSLANPLFRAALAADSSDEDDDAMEEDLMPAPLVVSGWHTKSPGPWVRNRKVDPTLAEMFWRNNPAQGVVANRVLKGGVTRDIEGCEGVARTPLDEALQRGEASRLAARKYLDAHSSGSKQSTRDRDDCLTKPEN